MDFVMVQDVREKKGKHDNVEQYCKQMGIPIVRKMLTVGDYRLAKQDDNGELTFINNISVDIKGGGLLELANDLYHDKKDFNKKYRKCFNEHIKLFVLIEEKPETLQEFIGWHNAHTKINGRMLMDLMYRLEVSYGIVFKFCDKHSVGQNLLSILIKGK